MTVFHESYGEITPRLLQVIKKFNVSPSDWSELEMKYGEGNLKQIESAIVTYSKNGMYQPYLMWTGQQ